MVTTTRNGGSVEVQLPGLAYRVAQAVIREHILSCSSEQRLRAEGFDEISRSANADSDVRPRREIRRA